MYLIIIFIYCLSLYVFPGLWVRSQPPLGVVDVDLIIGYLDYPTISYLSLYFLCFDPEWLKHKHEALSSILGGPLTY